MRSHYLLFFSSELTRVAEGLVTAVVAIAWFFLLPDFPEESKFLTEEEKEWVRTRLSQDVGESEIEEKTTWRAALKVISDCAWPSSPFTYTPSDPSPQIKSWSARSCTSG